MAILEYLPEHKEEVIELILGIQTNEFGITITQEQQPDLQDIVAFIRKVKVTFGCINT